MSTHHLPGEIGEPGETPSDETQKSRLDLVILQSMARKLVVTLHTLERPGEATLPLSYSFEERRGRQHRMILFAPHELLALEEMHFVGFVSRQRRMAEQHVVEALFRANEVMLAEIAQIPGLLSYSSLELHPGNWYNLVLFCDASVKAHVKGGKTHHHAAYELSPAYYEWIRLHNGTLPNGLARQELRLNSTRYYRFPNSHQMPVAHDLNYKACTDAC